MKLTADEKRAHVEAWKASGESMDRYAKAHGLSASSLCRWTKGEGMTGRAAHPKRYAFEQLLAEGLTPWKASLALGLDHRTAAYWTRND